MMYKVAISSAFISIAMGLSGYAVGWIDFSGVVVMTISGVASGLVVFQSSKRYQ